jgi:hypothetical protein
MDGNGRLNQKFKTRRDDEYPDSFSVKHPREGAIVGRMQHRNGEDEVI